jgi:hypothetical protein
LRPPRSFFVDPSIARGGCIDRDLVAPRFRQKLAFPAPFTSIFPPQIRIPSLNVDLINNAIL